MKQKNHASIITGRSAVICVVIGVVVAAITTALLSAGLTSLVMRGTVTEKTTSPFVFTIRLLAVLLGSLVGTSLSSGKILPVVGFVTGVYIVILLSVGITVYDGSFHNFGAGVISTILGAIIACLIKYKAQMKPKRTFRHKR